MNFASRHDECKLKIGEKQSIQKLRIYSVWGDKDNNCSTVVEGKDRPQFVDGTPMPDTEEFKFEIQAVTWGEAMAIYNLRMGWEPYKSGGEI